MSQRLPAVKPKEVLRALGRAGFFIHHTSGSHHVLKHPEKPAGGQPLTHFPIGTRTRLDNLTPVG